MSIHLINSQAIFFFVWNRGNHTSLALRFGSLATPDSFWISGKDLRDETL